MGSITLKSEDYQVIGRKTDHGYSIELSAYDIPQEVKVGYIQKDGILHIDFTYLDNEESISKDLSSKSRMKVGKHSGKILGFELEVEKYEINTVNLTLQRAVEAEIQKVKPFNQRANFQVIRSILDRQQAYIFADVIP